MERFDLKVNNTPANNIMIKSWMMSMIAKTIMQQAQSQSAADVICCYSDARWIFNQMKKAIFNLSSSC